MNTSLQQLYQNKIISDLQRQFKYTNRHEVPKLVKITINRGIGEASQNAKALENSINEFQLITGQKPIVTRSKKAIAGFKIREDIPIGITVNLRKQKCMIF
jgi:large subunit ribosomal protein L5